MWRRRSSDVLGGLEVVASGVCLGYQGCANGQGGVDLRLWAGWWNGGDLRSRGGYSAGGRVFRVRVCVADLTVWVHVKAVVVVGGVDASLQRLLLDGGRVGVAHAVEDGAVVQGRHGQLILLLEGVVAGGADRDIVQSYVT